MIFEEGDHVIAIWFCPFVRARAMDPKPKADGDIMATLLRRNGIVVFEHRFRYVVDDKVGPASEDEKHFYMGSASPEDSARPDDWHRQRVHQTMHLIAKHLRAHHQLDRVDIDGPPELIYECCKNRSWFHVVPASEYQDDKPEN